MKLGTRRRTACAGIALIIVMIVIVVFGILAGGFAYSMKVETKLARNTSYEPELEWIGRSGVEFARYILCQELMVRGEPWDSLNQRWAGGPMGTNEALMNISLANNPLGSGSFSVQIVDLERKFNINMADEEIMKRALAMVGADPGAVDSIVDAFLDWRDPDDDPRLGGAETPQYLQTPNPGFAPYMAKNGLIDDVSELLLIRGITPQMYWGGRGMDGRLFGPALGPAPAAGAEVNGAPAFQGGLIDLFTAVSVGLINVNTASPEALSLIPGIDDSMAHAIVTARAGPDGVDGTEDDTPFRDPGELINVPGMAPPMVNAMRRYLTTRSSTFEVHVQARIGQCRRNFVAVLRRNNPRDARLLYFYWE